VPIPDSPPGTPDASCVVDGLDLCAQSPADNAITFGNETFDTGNDPRCRDVTQGGGGETLCLVYATSITVSAGATLTVTGNQPLVLAASGTLQVDGTIDAGSTSNRRGPDSEFGGCPNFPAAAESDLGGGGGGAGASFLADGGNGGTGDSDMSSGGGNGNAAGGTRPAPVGTPSILRGGCDGQDGGDEGGGGGSGNGGTGGSGGGAVWLVATGSVQVPGAVRATGAGGAGGETQAGGGGGGSGGMIKISAPTIVVPGQLSANGGGGGGGGGRIGGNDINGSPGNDGLLGTLPAAGGAGATQGGTEYGGRGGTGGAQAASTGQTGGTSVVGAGGGGGSGGYVVIHGNASITGVVSPPHVTN
jgi:hypothetical protein